MDPIKTGATLADLQAYVKEMKIERGFDKTNAVTECFLLGEEMGELFKAVRKAENWETDPNSDVHNVGEELADCLIYLSAIANLHNIDLEHAFREKEAKNNKRQWIKVE